MITNQDFFLIYRLMAPYTIECALRLRDAADSYGVDERYLCECQKNDACVRDCVE